MHAVPTAVRRHDSGNAGFDRCEVAGQMRFAQRRLVNARVALVQWRVVTRAESGSAFGDIMFPTSRYSERIREIIRLETADSRFAEHLDDVRVLAIALVGSSPANILRNGDAGAKSPVDAGGANFFRRDARHRFH